MANEEPISVGKETASERLSRMVKQAKAEGKVSYDDGEPPQVEPKHRLTLDLNTIGVVVAESVVSGMWRFVWRVGGITVGCGILFLAGWKVWELVK